MTDMTNKERLVEALNRHAEALERYAEALEQHADALEIAANAMAGLEEAIKEYVGGLAVELYHFKGKGGGD